VIISAGARVKKSGEAMRGEPVELVARHRAAQGESAYQRLLGEALHGDASQFSSDEAVEAAWTIIGPALGNASPVHEYEPGTWGPEAADALTADDGGWHDPAPEETPPC
jgi:glucose-6-phosphate 1-dehydrogenase